MYTFTASILINWTIGISLMCIFHELFFSEYFYEKTGLKTYYYKRDSVHYVTNYVDTNPILFRQNSSNEKLLTDSSWLLLVGYILPILFIIMLLPVLLMHNVPKIIIFPLFLWLYNSIIITIRKRLNDYDELSELESPYRHRFIPTSLLISIILNIVIFILVSCYIGLTTVHLEIVPLILIIFYVLIDNIVLFMDKFIKDSSNDFREVNNYKNLLKILMFIIIITVLILLLVFLIGFNINKSVSYYQSAFDNFLEYQKSRG